MRASAPREILATLAGSVASPATNSMLAVVSFDLRQDAARVKTFEKILGVRRMEIEGRAWLERRADCAEDADELVVVDVLAEVERERRIERLAMTLAKRGDV